MPPSTAARMAAATLSTYDAVGYLPPLLRSFFRPSPKPVCLTKLPGFAFPDFGYLFRVPTLSEKLESLPALNQVVVPDLWQQQAVAALREEIGRASCRERV